IRSALVAASRPQRALGRTADARASLQEAVELTEAMQADLAGGEEIRAGFLRERAEPYFALADMALAEGRAEEALLLTERGRARARWGGRGGGRARVEKPRGREGGGRGRGRGAAVSGRGTSLRRERQRRTADPARVAELEGGLRSARLERDAFATRLY